jgi:hypothetical protein
VTQRVIRDRRPTAAQVARPPVSQPRRANLKIVGYFATVELREALDQYFSGRTVITGSTYASEDHFWTDRTPDDFTGRRTRTVDEGRVDDSYHQGCQTVSTTLTDFYDSFCMLYSMYNQARGTYFDEVTHNLAFQAPACLPPLFTVRDEEWLFRTYAPVLQGVPLEDHQKKELCRLLSNRDLLVKLFRIMQQDPQVWQKMKPIWNNKSIPKERRWTEPVLRDDFNSAIAEFAAYTFEQDGVPHMTFIDLLATKPCNVAATEQAKGEAPRGR